MRVTESLKRCKGVGILIGLSLVILALAVGCTQQATPSTNAPAQTTATTTVTATSTAPAPGASTGIVSGKITNSLTKAAVAGAKVVTDPAIPNQNITTDATGSFTVTLPIGVYKLAISGTGYTAGTDSVSIVAGQTQTKNVILVPTSPVAVSAGAAQTAAPGAAVTLKATATPLDGSTVQSYEWTQVSGPTIALANNKTDTLSVTLPKAADYKAALLKGLELLNRVEVKAINPHSLSAAMTATFKATVTTTSGTYSGNVNVTANLPYEITTGLLDVPQGAPVLLNSKQQASWNWTITGPSGSKATLDEATSRNPVFIPDVVGKYSVNEAVSKASLDIYAGTWAGAISGQDAKGRPVAAGCTACHDGKTAPDKFTSWAQSGHAEIFTQNINDPAGHWAINCSQCHTVGYEPNVTNGGFDEAMKAENWVVPPHGDKGLYTEMLKTYPKTTHLSNIQCENCHGPNNSALHANGTIDASRVSLSADVCGSCHGEPPRHGRFQQWEESGHGNYELAIDESGSASCARCHTAQGFLTWIKQGDLTKQIQGKAGNATAAEMAAIVTKDNAQPQTCVVCHEPHNPGSTTGEPTNAKVRIVDATAMLPAGFKAEVVGKGAICITCHNTRNTVHNQSAAPTNYQAPHTAAQGDVLMGENAYFVPTSTRSPHSLIENTCVACHLNETPPPAEYSNAGAGTNHEFSASINICGSCHTDKLSGEALQSAFEGKLTALAAQMSAYLLKKMPASITILEYTPHTFNNVAIDAKSDPVIIAKDNIVSLESTEPHGQQGFIMKLKNPISVTYKPAGGTVHSLNLSTVTFQLGDLMTGDGKTAVVAPTDNLVKAGWNYFLLHGDSSKGVHNPAWETDILNASIDALK